MAIFFWIVAQPGKEMSLQELVPTNFRVTVHTSCWTLLVAIFFTYLCKKAGQIFASVFILTDVRSKMST